MKIVIHAINIHQGGGKTLLSGLLNSVASHEEIILLADVRMEISDAIQQKITIFRFNPTVLSRLTAEFKLLKISKKNDLVLCFGNLPPIFKLSSRVSVFVQNRYLVDNISFDGLPLTVKLRLMLERLWLYCRASNAHEFIVQTVTMKKVLSRFIKHSNSSIKVTPFLDFFNIKTKKISMYDFIYVASGEAHKNHRRLISAWCLLARQGLFPSLCLTLRTNEDIEVLNFMETKKNEYGLKIFNTSNVDRISLFNFYESSHSLIYPSLLESFGVPLIEAKQSGMPILASELDFVRDLVDPVQTFDPTSINSIARAVKRHLKIHEERPVISDPRNFLNELINRSIVE